MWYLINVFIVFNGENLYGENILMFFIYVKENW